MKDLRGRVEYLKGLSEGLALDTASREGKMITQMLQVVGEMADGIASLASEHDNLQAYVDVLDADLQDLEEAVSGEYEDNDEDDVEAPGGGREEEHGRPPGPSGFRTGIFNCPTCGETVQMSDGGTAEPRRTTESGLVMVMLTCPECGTLFGVTEPDAVTYIEPRDELTDLPYSTKESS